jgi:hypothetical protein
VGNYSFIRSSSLNHLIAVMKLLDPYRRLNPLTIPLKMKASAHAHLAKPVPSHLAYKVETKSSLSAKLSTQNITHPETQEMHPSPLPLNDSIQAVN